MSASEVRGSTVDGLYVSSAACDMLSRPTNEMMASEIPSKRLSVEGQCTRIVRSSISGCQASTKPATSMSVSLTTSMPDTISLTRDEWRTPMTLMVVKNAVTPSTATKYQT